MQSLLRKCRNCRLYTMKNICPSCSSETVVPIPARYSPQDSYGAYRRKLKKLENKKMQR